jgi:MFS family permease
MAPDPEPSPGSSSEPKPRRESAYPAAFWLAYAANLAAVTASALTFRFAELVQWLGGSERTAGLVIGVATATALLSRLYLGQAIDRHGVRRLWLFSSILFIAGGACLTAVDSLTWMLYAARSLFAIGLAGMYTCSTVHIQSLVPPERRTEVIGALGSSGFLGMIFGAVLGDVIFHGLDGKLRFTILFGASTILGLLYTALVLFITRDERHVRPTVTPALHRLAVRHWPGNVMLVAFVMGLMLAVTTVFLTRFATYRHLSGLGPFFAAYAGSAFTFRIASRGWSRTIGRHRMILLGVAGHAVAMTLLPFVTTEWLFAIPAVFGGFGHALLFPCVVSLGAEAFPREYRGTGTTLVMGFFDVGTFVSAPILGGIIDAFDGTGFAPMFLTAATVAVISSFIYLATTARTPDSDLLPAQTARPELVAIESSARGPFVSRSSPIEPFAREASARETLAPERFVYGPSAREGIAPEPSATESPAPQPLARQEFAGGISAREGSSCELPARESSARGNSAPEGMIGRAPSAPPHDRAAVPFPAARCR